MLLYDLRKKIETPLLPSFQGKKVAIICSHPIGDGIVSLILSHNFYLNGIECNFFHPKLILIKEWFPHLAIQSDEEVTDHETFYHQYDKIFLFFDSTPLQKKLLKYEEKAKQDKLFVIIPTLSKPSKASHVKLDPKISMVQNCLKLSKEIFGLSIYTSRNGMTPLACLNFKNKRNRVLIHPTAGQQKKRWCFDKFLMVFDGLKKSGFQPLFVISSFEEEELKPLLFNYDYVAPDLVGLIKLIYQSGYLIGNDSALGHISASLNIPTLSIFWHRRMSRLWRPDFRDVAVLAPPSFLFNIAGCRLRDRYWKTFITVPRVLSVFQKLST